VRWTVQKDNTPGQRDADVAELKRMLTASDMLLPSMTTSYLAFDKLQSLVHL